MFDLLKAYIEKKYQDKSISHNLNAGNYDQVIWILGDGRSGTTWLFDLLGFDNRYRKMFEPVHPFFVDEAAHMSLNHYMTRENEDRNTVELLGKIFSGKLRSQKVDQFFSWRFIHKGLLVKDIYANLLAGWVNENYPKIKKVFIMRNPIPVALSKMKRNDWIWMEHPEDFLNQDLLVRDHLRPFQTFIQGVEDDFLTRQVLAWAIIHYVPFRQLKWQDACFVLYEDLYARPREEMKRIFQFLGVDADLDSAEFNEMITKPTKVSGDQSNILKGASPLYRWEKEVPDKTRKRCYEILTSFGLQEIYGPDFREPSMEELRKVVKSLETAL